MTTIIKQLLILTFKKKNIDILSKWKLLLVICLPHYKIFCDCSAYISLSLHIQNILKSSVIQRYILIILLFNPTLPLHFFWEHWALGVYCGSGPGPHPVDTGIWGYPLKGPPDTTRSTFRMCPGGVLRCKEAAFCLSGPQKACQNLLRDTFGFLQNKYLSEGSSRPSGAWGCHAQPPCMSESLLEPSYRHFQYFWAPLIQLSMEISICGGSGTESHMDTKGSLGLLG